MSQPESITDAFLPLVPDVIEAGKYRGWAATSTDPVERGGLIVCEEANSKLLGALLSEHE
ncbi:MAG: putative short-subunit dehydrogenase-like oxidoreductase (DUF2520 family) [Flavobacterium sp.]|jgi:predicted short-subunit dehydrogenase-like oxidoreductase (DUF2520 family)